MKKASLWTKVNELRQAIQNELEEKQELLKMKS